MNDELMVAWMPSLGENRRSPNKVAQEFNFQAFKQSGKFLQLMVIHFQLISLQGARTSPRHEFVNQTATNRARTGDASHFGLHAAEKSRSHGHPSIDNDCSQPANVSTASPVSR